MRIIITGTGGRLGAAVARHLRDRHRVIAWDRRAMDLREPERIRDHFGAVRFDAVIHCAALTAVDYCEDHPDEARAVNTEAPALLARICQDRGARLIQVSTDYVYDGRLPGLRRESDPADPLGVYARTKREGEEAVLGVCPDFLVARTSWVFGPDRPSFADTILERARRGGDCGAVADKWSNPSYSHDLAAMLEALALNPAATGIVNLCNAGGCSWLEYGQACLDIAAEAGVALKCRTLKPLGLHEIPAFTAPRPVHTSMDTGRLVELTGAPVRPWREALAEYIRTYHARCAV